MPEPAISEYFHWAVTGIISSYAGIITWLGKGMYDDMKELKKASLNNMLDLAGFKTEVAKDYAKETTLDKSMDLLAGDIREIRGDVKKVMEIIVNNNKFRP